MSDDGEPGFLSVRPKVLLLIGAVTGSLLLVAVVVAWFGLPRWAPAFVVAKSPWIGPAFTAVLHGGSKSEFRNRLAEWGDGVVPAMCAALGSRDPGRRSLAAEILQERKDPRSVEPLIAALDETDPEVLPEVLQALGEIGDQRASAPVLEAIPRIARHDAHLARNAAFLVGTLAHPQLFDQVSATLLAPTQPAPMQALGCLALHGSADPRALTVLEERLGKTNVAVLRRWESDLAGEALGRSRQPGALAIIQRALADADADRRFGAAVAALTNKDPSLLEPLLILSAEPVERMQWTVCQALAKHPHERAVAALGRMVGQGGEAAGFAASALGWNRSPAAVPMMLSHLGHPEGAIRAKMIEGLNRRAKQLTPADLGAILRLVGDGDRKVQEALRFRTGDLGFTPEQRRLIADPGR